MRLASSSSETSGFVGSFDHGFTVDRYFGANGVSAYLRAASNGAFSYAPAVGDGVVDVDYPGSVEDFSTAQSAGIAALRSADPSVDYASFDRNRNGRVDGDELAFEVVVLGGDRRGPGATRTIAGYDPSFSQLDGVSFSSDFSVAAVNAYSTFMTAVHELFHQSFAAPDAYEWGVGHLDVMGPTYDEPDTARWMASGPLRMQLGWLSPQRPTGDGTFNANRPIVVHDDFLVEVRGGSSWDHDATAPGVVLWRLHPKARRYELLTPAVVQRDARLARCDATGCRRGERSDAFTSATVPLRYGDGTTPYSSGAYTGVVLHINGANVTVDFDAPLPSPSRGSEAPVVRRPGLASTSTSTSSTTTSTSILTAAPGLWRTVFDTAELQRLLSDMCVLDLPGCAVYQVEQFLLYP